MVWSASLDHVQKLSVDLICRWKVWMWILCTYLTSRWTKPRNKGAEPTVLMGESIVSLFSPFSSVKKGMRLGEVGGPVGYFLIFFSYSLCSLYVISLPYWVDLVWKGRASQEGGNWKFIMPIIESWNVEENQMQGIIYSTSGFIYLFSNYIDKMLCYDHLIYW